MSDDELPRQSTRIDMVGGDVGSEWAVSIVEVGGAMEVW